MITMQNQTIGLFQKQMQLVPYVSPDLKFIELPISENHHQDVIREGVTFRRLDADYFVWIEQTVTLVQKAHARGRIPQKAYSGLMNRYRVVQKWIEANISRKVLIAARKRSNLAEYSPPQAVGKEKPQPESPKPRPYLFPVGGVWEHTVPIDPAVVKLVDAIRDEALSKGWTEASLYQNRGHYPAGKWYGLVCVLDITDRIEKIDDQSIHIRTFKGAAIPAGGEIVKYPNQNYSNDDAKSIKIAKKPPRTAVG